MTLTDYLTREAITTEQFARVLGVDPVSVRRYLRGKRRPNWEVMQRIMKVTGGTVTPNDFVAEIKSKRRVRPSGREARAA